MSSSSPLRVALVGIGKIARDQHVPVLAAHPEMALVATVSRNAEIEGIPGFRSLAEAFETVPEIDAVVLCTPPRVHYHQAREALIAGRHVFLEKPPVASLAEMDALQRLAADSGLTLFASWHSRCAAAVEPARRWLQGREVKSVDILWKEDVRRWHPGQDWIFEPGGMGVFDPGVNALSIVTCILPRPFALTHAILEVPDNRAAPIAASLAFEDEAGVPIRAELDFRQADEEIWEIVVGTTSGSLVLVKGGAGIVVDGVEQALVPASEYQGLYDRFVELVHEGSSDADVTPLIHVADAFLLGERRAVPAFEW
ncbi:MAG: Gfo/Idh/MocA family protein [Pseudomonadales bacterium]